MKKNNSNKFSRFFLALLLGVSISLSTACDQSSEPTGNDHKLELWTMQLKPTFNDYMNKLLENYKKDHPGLQIEWVDLPAKEIEQKTLTAIAGGKSPDVINLNPNFTAKLAEVGALTDLETLVSKETKEKYFENIWKSATIGGKTYGFPWYLSTAITIYNKDLFQKAGLDPEKPPKTFAELAEVGKTIKEKTGKYVFSPNFADSGKILEYLVQEGIPLLSDDQRKAAFNTPAAEKFIQFWLDLTKNKIIPQDSITQGHREVIDRFQAGETAVLVSGPQFLKIVAENAPQLYKNIGIGTQLSGNSEKIGVGVMNLVLPQSGKHREEAAKLAEYITNGSNQLDFAKIVTILPSVKEAAQDNYFTNLPTKPELNDSARKISAEQLKNATVLLPSVKKWSELSKIFDQYFQQAYLGQITPKEALEKAESEWNTILGNQ